MEPIRISTPEYRLIQRLRHPGICVVRQTSELETAIRTGRGYFYFLHPAGSRLQASVCIGLMGKGVLESAGDDLFTDIDRGGQTYHLASPLPELKLPRARKRS